ncbi:hypothetical protein MBGDN05_00207 [Thermoplasmatales archaeon SCGC AB-539-N05]|nr:hypothetical protein MBGDN05_00742 [Thermoplasmatales archaeon SCGC AB-539-N05]EMR74417.1 hypothetical protein MBGDN05_00207 [Thermoplasmatales archaeon SCGC AB-539-N05]
MKIKPQCVPCLLKRIIYETELSTQNDNLRAKALSAALATMSKEYNPCKCSADIATKVHKAAYQVLDDRDPYKELKKQSNKIALSLLPIVENLIQKSQNPLKTSMACSIIGNIMDFGIDGAPNDPTALSEMFEEKFNEGLGHNDLVQVEQILKNARHVVFITDNCGEIVFDKLVCRELKQFNKHIHLTLVVRGEPILTDATLEDAQQLGFSTVVDNIVTTGSFAVGINFAKLPENLRCLFDKTDLIICKGMANYEAFSETTYRPIVYLLRIKCDAVADDMNLPADISAIKLYT